MHSRLMAVAAALLWICLAGAAQAAGAVEAIDVRVTAENSRYALAPSVQDRMQASVQTIAEHLLAGKSVEEADRRKYSDANLIREVFGRILIGYTVRSVEVFPGEHTRIDVRVVPWQDVIQRLDVKISVDGVPEEIAKLAEADARGVDHIFSRVLLGLPMDAVEWTGGIVKAGVNEFLAVHLPEFRADFEVEAGTDAVVNLTLYPKGAMIRDVNLSLRSGTVPNLLLMNYRPAIESRAKLLVGVPVGFAERHQSYFIQSFTEKLNADHNLRSLGVQTKMEMTVGDNTNIRVDADTDRYHLSVEGYLDMGREEDSTSFRLHAGKSISPRDELFLEVDFLPHDMKWVFMPGVSRKITPQFTAGFKYNMDERANVLWAKQAMGERWMLRLEHMPSREFNEFALRYKVHDFVGLEYVVNDDDNWLRLIGNF